MAPCQSSYARYLNAVVVLKVVTLHVGDNVDFNALAYFGASRTQVFAALCNIELH